MRLRSQLSILNLSIFTTSLFAQLTTPPVLKTPPNIPYPPIARAAHVEGDVSVSFSIDSEGRTVSVQTISGPHMLSQSVEQQIRQWTFNAPLPVAAQHDFVATYKFRLHSNDENLDDDLDAPSYSPCCGDSISLPAGATQITAEVRSTDGSQTIDTTPAPPQPTDRCPEDKERQPPSNTTSSDFVELYRIDGTQSLAYQVRVYRDGNIEWHGKQEVAIKGDLSANISLQDAASLLARFQTTSFWAACAAQLPSSEQKIDEDFPFGNYLTVTIGGHTKSVNTSRDFFNVANEGRKLAWAVDKAANTHRWRHGDSAIEPYDNMQDDLDLPKPGITALMRSTLRFSESNAQQTLEPLKHFIAAGADIDAADESGWTALMYAAQLAPSNDAELQLLVDAHANVNRSSLHGDTALMMAAYRGYLPDVLLKKGARINARNADGVTTLMLLAQHSDADTLKRALDAGADPNLQDNAGRTALDYLRAASCHKPLIPLPKSPGGMITEIIPKDPPSCPSKSAEFLTSQSLLKAAMAKSPTH